MKKDNCKHIEHLYREFTIQVGVDEYGDAIPDIDYEYLGVCCNFKKEYNEDFDCKDCKDFEKAQKFSIIDDLPF